MANGRGKNYVSFWFWFFAIFLTALPCVGILFVIVFAFIGENETRKNCFRAVLAWVLIWTLLSAAILLLGLWPVIEGKLKSLPPPGQ
jgi:hypothetical protein